MTRQKHPVYALAVRDATSSGMLNTLNGLEREDISKFKLAADRQAEHWCFENMHATLEEWAGLADKTIPARQDVISPDATDWSIA